MKMEWNQKHSAWDISASFLPLKSCSALQRGVRAVIFKTLGVISEQMHILTAANEYQAIKFTTMNENLAIRISGDIYNYPAPFV
jgi:hypothetical protein